MDIEYPCPCCGFFMFEEPPGTFDICEVCGWEDDNAQLQHPLNGGANHYSLVEGQLEILKKVPLSVKQYEGFSRDPTWRPITEDEAKSENAPTDGLSYFHAVVESEPSYYWRKK